MTCSENLKMRRKLCTLLSLAIFTFPLSSKGTNIRSQMDTLIASGQFNREFDATPKKLICNVIDKPGYKYNEKKFKEYYIDRFLKSSSESCEILANTECNDWDWPEGYWGWVASKVMYVNYMTEMAKLYGIHSKQFFTKLEQYNDIVDKKISLREQLEKNQKITDRSAGVISLNNEDEKYNEELFNLQFQLAAAWEDYRTQLPEKIKNGIPKMSSVGAGCAGGIPVKIEFEQKPEIFGIISEFAWELCKARGINPWDAEDCVDWVVVRSQTQNLSGRYRFYLQWSDGTSYQGSIDTTRIIGTKPYQAALMRIKKSGGAELINGTESSG